MRKTRLAALAAATVLLASGGASAQNTVFMGILDDVTGPTADVGKDFAAAKADSLKWINANGGINGKTLEADAVDYSYKAPTAIATYKKWVSGRKPAVIYGYGTADTEALVSFVADDKIPYFSHSFSAKLTDPMKKSANVEKGTPFNFFHGATYSDGCRALVKWAAADWKKKGKPGQAKWVHLGDNHPYPNSPKDACLAFAKEAGFAVAPEIQYSMRPADFKAQCLTLKESGAHYAYLANNAGPNIALLKSCATVGVEVQLLTNVWGFDDAAMAATGDAGDNIIVPLTVTPWGGNVPGMKRVMEIAANSGPQSRSPFYVAAVCSMFYIREALEWADKNGGINGDNIKKAMYQKKGWVPAGFEGVCSPATWTQDDHRSVVDVTLFRTKTKGGNAWLPVETVALGRDAAWLGR
ncbi:MAG: branched-chain amino acid ABC transporter substrate-binding protein [Alphaproteobacteria bacterium]|nr:branched-chain amino acid ABC transporter substrate-binding protein [Alphaproteobacteria bacterium]